MRALLPLSLTAVLLVSGCASVQRQLLYFPTHDEPVHSLEAWTHEGRRIGLARPVPAPRNVWLLLHGNGGQAANRVYALPCFSPEDSVYILEYPGYGQRPGVPSLESLNATAREAYDLLRGQFPHLPVCVAGESIGSGPACTLTSLPHPPDKLVLVVPFDALKHVADAHLPWFPTSLLLRDNWNNIESLKNYTGPLDIFAAQGDETIPSRFARALAATKPQAVFHEIDGGHNDWSQAGRVRIRNP